MLHYRTISEHSDYGAMGIPTNLSSYRSEFYSYVL